MNINTQGIWREEEMRGEINCTCAEEMTTKWNKNLQVWVSLRWNMEMWFPLYKLTTVSQVCGELNPWRESDHSLIGGVHTAEAANRLEVIAADWSWKTFLFVAALTRLDLMNFVEGAGRGFEGVGDVGGVTSSTPPTVAGVGLAPLFLPESAWGGSFFLFSELQSRDPLCWGRPLKKKKEKRTEKKCTQSNTTQHSDTHFSSSHFADQKRCDSFSEERGRRVTSGWPAGTIAGPLIGCSPEGQWLVALVSQ